jgi:hypothetical protein
MNYDMYKLRDWIDTDKIHWDLLSEMDGFI